MRVDKTFSELYDLTLSADVVVASTALLAINTIKRLQERIDHLERKISWWEDLTEEHREEIAWLKGCYHAYNSEKLQDILTQVTKEIEKNSICNVCKGNGYVEYKTGVTYRGFSETSKDICDVCSGSGKTDV